jgi:hypothetical protein
MFRTFPVEEVRVHVAKPEAPIGGLNQAVEVEIARTRKQWEQERAELETQRREHRES